MNAGLSIPLQMSYDERPDATETTTAPARYGRCGAGFGAWRARGNDCEGRHGRRVDRDGLLPLFRDGAECDCGPQAAAGRPRGRPCCGQCAFSAIEAGKAVAPQIYLTLDPGNAADLHESYRYYLGARTQLAARPQVKARPDLAPGAFTLTVADAHVTNAFFLSDDNIATLSLDLSDALRPEKLVVTQILALAANRMT